MRQYKRADLLGRVVVEIDGEERREVLHLPGHPRAEFSFDIVAALQRAYEQGREDRGAEPVLLRNGDIVTVGGRRYEFWLDKLNCNSTHRHHEQHADLSPGDERHHHHTAACEDRPRQVTLLRPESEVPLHDHDYGHDDACSCGAERIIGEPVSDGDGSRHVVEYCMPADDQHPEGWSYTRLEKP